MCLTPVSEGKTTYYRNDLLYPKDTTKFLCTHHEAVLSRRWALCLCMFSVEQGLTANAITYPVIANK